MSLEIGTEVICNEERLGLIGTGEIIDIDVDGDIAVKFPSMDSHYSNGMYRLHSCRGVDREFKSLWFRYGSPDYPAESLIVASDRPINPEKKMTRHNFAVGDECVILGDSRAYGHRFTSGEEVLIESIDGCSARCKSQNNSWYVHVDDLMFIRTSIINLEEVKWEDL